MNNSKVLRGYLIVIAIVIVGIVIAYFTAAAYAESTTGENGDTTFTLYGVTYTVTEQNISLSPQEVEARLDDYTEYDPELIMAIQRALKRHGYSVSVDGKFGPKTGMAIKKFQRQKGLTIDGIVGPRTLQALGLDDSSEHPRFAPNLREALDRSPCGKLIHLNLNSHLVEVYQYEDDGVHLLRVMLAATGSQKGNSFTNLCNVQLNRTPRLGGRISDSNWRGHYAVSITAGDYFHSVLAHRKNGKWQLDGNSVLGTNASHGCVRLAVEDAYWLQRFSEKGTTIVVDDRNWDFTNYIIK